MALYHRRPRRAMQRELKHSLVRRARQQTWRAWQLKKQQLRSCRPSKRSSRQPVYCAAAVHLVCSRHAPPALPDRAQAYTLLG